MATQRVLTLALQQAPVHATVGMRRRPMMGRTARRSTFVSRATATVVRIQHAHMQGLVRAHVSAILTSGAMQTAQTAKVSRRCRRKYSFAYVLVSFSFFVVFFL